MQRSFLGQVMTVAAVPACQGFGTRDPAPVRRVRRRRPGAHPPDADRQDPAGRRHRHPDPAHRRGRGRPRRRPGRRPLSSRSSSGRTRCSSRQGDDLHCTVDAADDGGRARHDGAAGDPRRPAHGGPPPGTQSGQAVTLRRPGRHPPAGAGARRPHRARRRARRRPGSTPTRRSCCASWRGCAARTGRTSASSTASSTASSPGCATPSTSADCLRGQRAI